MAQPAIGTVGLTRIGDDKLPILVTHHEADGTVSGVVFSAYPHRSGRAKPAWSAECVQATRLPRTRAQK